MNERETNEIDNAEINGLLFSEELYVNPENDLVKSLFWVLREYLLWFLSKVSLPVFIDHIRKK